MDLRALRYFIAAVDAGSITAAAELCHVAQPSISLAINKLEDELGTQLLARSKKGVSTTVAGQELYLRGQRLLAESASLVAHFREQQPLPGLAINLAVVLSLPRMRKLLSRFKELGEHYQLELSSANPEALLQVTSEDQVPRDYRFQLLWEDEYCLLLPLSHPLSGQQQLRLADLMALPLIERSFCERSGLWQHFIAATGFSPRISAQTDSEEWALALVEAGVGACIAPAPCQAEQYRIKVLPLTAIHGMPRVGRRLGLAWSPLLPEDVRQFLETVTRL